MNEECKLSEARYFLDQMRKPEIHDERVILNYHLSAFLTAARSVMQYILHTGEYYNEKKRCVDPRVDKWYGKEMRSSKWCSYFAGVRDANVHKEQPANPAANYSITLRETVTMSDIREGRLVMVTEEGEQVEMGEEADDDRRTLDVFPSTKGDDGFSQSVEYVIDVNGASLSLLDCCEDYLAELRSIVGKAKHEGIIT